MCAASNRVLMVMQFAGFPHNHGDRVGEVVLVLANVMVICLQSQYQYLRVEFLGSLLYSGRFSSGSTKSQGHCT